MSSILDDKGITCVKYWRMPNQNRTDCKYILPARPALTVVRLSHAGVVSERLNLSQNFMTIWYSPIILVFE